MLLVSMLILGTELLLMLQTQGTTIVRGVTLVWLDPKVLHMARDPISRGCLGGQWPA